MKKPPFAEVKALSTVKLYAGNVTKTRTKADNIAEKQINYLCVLRKNWGKSAVQLRAVLRPNVPAAPQTRRGLKRNPTGLWLQYGSEHRNTAQN